MQCKSIELSATPFLNKDYDKEEIDAGIRQWMVHAAKPIHSELDFAAEIPLPQATDEEMAFLEERSEMIPLPPQDMEELRSLRNDPEEDEESSEE